MDDLQSIDVENADIHSLCDKELTNNKITADVLRLDKIHPVVSGNKWFKLKHHLGKAKHAACEGIITFGGSWSNHIVATAYAASKSGLKSTGIIRGEEPAQMSQTLQDAATYGMQLKFITRNLYAHKTDDALLNDLLKDYANYYLIPEGGGGPLGVSGSKEILELTNQQPYSHILCCIGTGTMYTGLANASKAGTAVIGIPVLKGMSTQEQQFPAIISERKKECVIIPGYEFGGYARQNQALFRFMNDFYQRTSIPTDFVYTGKLMYASFDLVKNNYFAAGSRLLIIHSGGLQGNTSLRSGTLLF